MARLDRAFDALLLALARVAAAIFAAIALLIPVNVVLRNAFGTSLYGLLDAIEYGLLAATFLAAPWVLSINAHVAVDLLVAAVGGRARRTLEAAANLLGALVSAVFLWFSVVALVQSAERGTMIRTAFTIPEWWVLAVVPAGMGLIVLEFARKLARSSLGRPVAGP